ncbi:MAG: hypothetical protein KJ072_00255 [Verrucomicrobia bacterium]|nr:hypothetical protein [Verrucomicrobiota bacterium]
MANTAGQLQLEDNPLTRLLHGLANGSNRDSVERMLATAWDELNALPPEQRVPHLVSFLDSGKDAPTGFGFRVGSEGNLSAPPTVRVAALDWLGRFDSAAAAEYATRILATSDAPDEWAMALRNLGRTPHSQRNPVFRNAVRDFLARADWRSAPTGGYAEGLDAVVHLGDLGLIPEVLAAAQDAPALAPLIPVLLDNLVLGQPTLALPHVAENARLFDEQTGLRASLMSRADVRDPAQRQALEAYLLGDFASDDELMKFGRLFPHFNRFIGHHLLTVDRPRSIVEQAAIDQAALGAVIEWRSDPRFGGVIAPLGEIEARLRSHVESARRGGLLGH